MIRLKLLAAVAVVGFLLGVPVLAGPPNAPPPEILAILKKLGKGVQPTPEDQAKLEKWSAGASSGSTAAPAGDTGGGPATANGGGALHLTAGDSEGGEVCPRAGHAIAAEPVTADAYLAMAKAVRDSFGQKIPTDARSALFAALHDTAHPVAGGDIAVAMILRGHGSAAVVAAANGAIANPRDPVTANTLASALRGMKDYRNATLALGYARALSPRSTTLANNLAWLQFAQGDTHAASTMFNAAASNHKPSAQTLLGQGVIALCGRKYAQALPLFRQSLSQQWTDMAAAGVQVSEKGLQQGPDGAGTDLGSPDAYGPKGAAMPDWPDPVVIAQAQAFAASLKSLQRYVDGWVKAAQSAQEAMSPLVTRARMTSSTDIDEKSITFHYGYERQAFELDDIKNMIVARDEKAQGAYLDRVANLINADGPMTGATDDRQSCGAVRIRFNNNHTNFMSFYGPRRTAFRKRLADLWGFSAPIVASIDDRPTNQMAQALLNNIVASWQDAEAAPLTSWGLEGMAAYSYKANQCVFTPAPATPLRPLRNYPLDPNACKTPEVHMNFGIVNLNGDCAHLVLTFGELLQGSLDYKFGKDWGDDQLTIWAGANIGTRGELTNGAITGSAAAGLYATLGAHGTLLDAGVQTSASITGGLGHSSVPDINGGSSTVGSGQSGVNEQLGVTAKISLIDGPPNPMNGGRGAETGDGSLSSSYGLTFGGNATGPARDEIHNAQQPQ